MPLNASYQAKVGIKTGDSLARTRFTADEACCGDSRRSPRLGQALRYRAIAPDGDVDCCRQRQARYAVFGRPLAFPQFVIGMRWDDPGSSDCSRNALARSCHFHPVKPTVSFSYAEAQPMSASGYKIYPACQRGFSDSGSLVYEATYTIEDDKGLRGAPITVAGAFQSAEDALTAAQDAGEKLLAQMH
jgi:hypothetical protein